MDDVGALLEAIACEVGEGTGCDEPPVDALRIAALLGFEVRPGWARRQGATLFVPFGSAADEAVHWACAHELAHGLLDLEPGVDNSEENASYLAAAILVPRRSLCEEVRKFGWSLAKLHALYWTAPPLAIARRLAECRDGIASAWTSGPRLRRRFGHEYVMPPRPLPLETELARTCLERGAIEHPNGSAQIMIGPKGGRTAVVVVDAEV